MGSLEFRMSPKPPTLCSPRASWFCWVHVQLKPAIYHVTQHVASSFQLQVLEMCPLVYPRCHVVQGSVNTIQSIYLFFVVALDSVSKLLHILQTMLKCVLNVAQLNSSAAMWSTHVAWCQIHNLTFSMWRTFITFDNVTIHCLFNFTPCACQFYFVIIYDHHILPRKDLFDLKCLMFQSHLVSVPSLFTRRLSSSSLFSRKSWTIALRCKFTWQRETEGVGGA